MQTSRLERKVQAAFKAPGVFNIRAKAFSKLNETISVFIQFTGNTNACFIPDSIVMGSSIHNAGPIAGKNILITQKFMLSISVNIEGSLIIKLSADAEAYTAD